MFCMSGFYCYNLVLNHVNDFLFYHLIISWINFTISKSFFPAMFFKFYYPPFHSQFNSNFPKETMTFFLIIYLFPVTTFLLIVFLTVDHFMILMNHLFVHFASQLYYLYRYIMHFIPQWYKLHKQSTRKWVL